MTNQSHELISPILNISDRLVESIVTTTGVELSDYERDAIFRLIQFNQTPVPNNYMAVLEKMEELANIESIINFIIYNLEMRLLELTHEFNSKYYSLFTRNSRSQMYSNQEAVRSATYSHSDSHLVVLEDRMSKFRSIINLLRSELFTIKSKAKSLDAKRSNTF